ncbi:hypothetical protein RKD19_003833 [Streptomyces canus]
MSGPSVLVAARTGFSSGMRPGQLRERIGARYELEDPALAAGGGPAERALLQGGHQTRVEQRGLARARGAHQHHQAAGAGPGRRAEQLDEGFRAPLPAEEPAGVLLPVGGEAPVRADPGGRLGLGALVLVRRQCALPQPLPLAEVVQTGRDGGGTDPPGFGNEDVQHGRESGELRGYVPGPAPVADALRGDPDGPSPLVHALEPADALGHALEGRITCLSVQQCETLREGRACS